MARESWIVGLERRRRDVVAAPPDPDLVLAKFAGGLGLVEALERAVMPLVQPPRVVDGQPHEIEIVEDDPQRPDRPFED